MSRKKVMKKEPLVIWKQIDLPVVDTATSVGLRRLAAALEVVEQSGQFVKIVEGEEEPGIFYGGRYETNDEKRLRQSKERADKRRLEKEAQKQKALVASILERNPGVEYDTAGPLARAFKTPEARKALSASMIEPVKPFVKMWRVDDLDGHFYKKDSAEVVGPDQLVMPVR